MLVIRVNFFILIIAYSHQTDLSDTCRKQVQSINGSAVCDSFTNCCFEQCREDATKKCLNSGEFDCVGHLSGITNLKCTCGDADVTSQCNSDLDMSDPSQCESKFKPCCLKMCKTTCDKVTYTHLKYDCDDVEGNDQNSKFLCTCNRSSRSFGAVPSFFVFIAIIYRTASY